MGPLLGLVIAIVLGALFFGLIIWIVGRLGLGIEVDGFGSAVVAGIVISLLNNMVLFFLPDLNGWVGAIIGLVIAALVIMLSGNLLRGLRVNGFVGALVAAIAIGVVQWLLAIIVAALTVGAVAA